VASEGYNVQMPRFPRRLLAVPVLLLVACPGPDDPTPVPQPAPTSTPMPMPTGPTADTFDTGTTEPTLPNDVLVTVTLDGDPIEDAWLSVGGGMSTRTDARGEGTVQLDGGDVLIASHPEARAAFIEAKGATATIALERFSDVDNPAYLFQDPGVAGEKGNTGQCVHCHGSTVIDWTASPHRDAASNPAVHDVFAGTAQISDATDCVTAGGQWREGIAPGTTNAADRCYLGAGTLPDLNDDCGDTTPCDGIAENTGGCADCHAPGIDGELGDRSLLEATGRAYTEGVHCDVCHKVEAVDLTLPPGIAGALRILRPSEPSSSPLEDWAHLTFGPLPDVPNPRMGAVEREHFRSATFCGGCHELVQDAQVPGQSIDAARWPDGLPIHSTYSEWFDGPYAPASPCQSCHMPPDPRWGNAADLTEDVATINIASGWWRPPGTVRRHLWDGPRGVEGLLQLAAAIDLEVDTDAGITTAVVTTSNVGAGHAIPTGEPMRSLVLLVEARCGAEPLLPAGGDVVPSFGGALDARPSGEDWTMWPGAQVGEQIRVVGRSGWRDYTGPGPFGDGTFDPAAKGLPLETWLGQATVLAVDGDQVTLDGVLPAGDVAYRVDGVGLPADGEPLRAWAGAPGFAFARVLADDLGNLQVAHHRAVDIVSDNRLLPQQAMETTHRFVASCAAPTVTARLVHRPYPLAEARLRRWDAQDQVMAEATQ